ncbi:alpha/beta hydrolase [Aetokthonos hydrillicola Thurmond2011]|jgi:phospholipase/carboxylesterase|uniref:Alpha/beta hydrolase n=1 Tax=Aetokthonos hydrillicola Thurmond2011 TaxID=2712845 RepID=A0AAP5IAG3_9CYAN|nr:alpha/beta hydrolase [Aetokthonos hydrillicola]MBO3459471.1 alpha/beta hydrolase [Aetokthonos hydrillicola CCALA 1050]MBW4583834.1 alpha/beta hydrolase [Aetokthonos hydrillicola CCALA 1050]MDR9895470.1 alpha/beta hydrolase [Aetokthonos hydrillicola Thurmond2011]
MNNSLEVITVPPKSGQAPKGLIVTLHGWGANAEDVASLSPYFNLPNYQFLFPDAPFPFPDSSVGRAWYDLRMENMYQGLIQSRELLTDWLQSLESTTGIPLSRTILSGFSQGGAMTLDVGLKLPLAGLVAMSGYLHPSAEGLKTLDAKSVPPVLITHGKQDTVVPLEAAISARKTLESLGVTVKYQEFDMGHEISPEVLELFRNFVVDTLS